MANWGGYGEEAKGVLATAAVVHSTTSAIDGMTSKVNSALASGQSVIQGKMQPASALNNSSDTLIKIVEPKLQSEGLFKHKYITYTLVTEP